MGHDTLLNEAKFPPVAGVPTSDQLVPSHDSMSAWAWCEVSSAYPTATQWLGPEQDTPFRRLSLAPWSGLDCTDHEVPSHDSTRVRKAVSTV